MRLTPQAGCEANVAVSLANYGQDALFVTKLPPNPLGEVARNALRRFGVKTKDIVWGGPRLGVYFVEKGASQRASKDRRLVTVGAVAGRRVAADAGRVRRHDDGRADVRDAPADRP